MCQLAGRNLPPGDSAGQSSSFASGCEGHKGKSMMSFGENNMNELER